MDKLRVAKVDVALLQQGRTCRSGTLHLTQHHLIIVVAQSVPPHQKQDATEDSGAGAVGTVEEAQEVWIAYSMLWLVTRLSSIIPIASSTGKPNKAPGRRIYPLSLHFRNFEHATLGFESETVATDVFESIKAAAIADAPQRLYAFYYSPKPALPSAPAGWRIYDFKAEFARQGVGQRTKGWRFCDVNAGYGFSPTYPSLMCVPSRISDSTIRYAAKFRSKERIPALTYLHRANLASITRSSQPMVGLNNRSMQDEKLVEAIFTSHLAADPASAVAQAAANNVTSSGNPVTERGKAVTIYGATSANLIIDARPTTNAMANRAKGAGTENMEHYRGCKKVYLGIDNIHVMRDSLNRVTDALRAAQAPATFGMQMVAAEQILATTDLDGKRRRRSSILTAEDAPPLDHLALKRSAWLKHISALLEGTLIIARNVHVYNSHVLIHCSDGWDRTSQLAALAQICLDPYFRTRRGFAVLIEKDWISFGHRFWDRCGHASSEKYFATAEGYGGEPISSGGSVEDGSGDEEGTGAAAEGFDAQAAANAFWGFTKQLRANFQAQDGHGKRGAHLKETSPVFHQFLDCVWQIMRQHPKRFEFNETWLLDLYDAVHECKFGNFLFNCERERNGFLDGQSSAPASSQTYSVWDDMLGGPNDDAKRNDRYLNPRFERALDSDTKRDGADMGVLLPNSKDVGFWGGLFRRDAKDINQLVRAEAEERRRQVEALERQRRQEQLDAEAAASATPVSAMGPSEVDGVTVGPLISSAEADPVLRAGVVDVHKFDTTKLAYKPRTRSSNSVSSSVSGSAREPLQTATAANGIGEEHAASRSPVGRVERDDSSLGAQEAANKMKNMFLGWGARLQDAYTTATAVGPDEGGASSADATSSLPRVVEANHATSTSGYSQQPRWNSAAVPAPPSASAPPRRAQAVRAGSNPWAASDETLDGLPNTLQVEGRPSGRLVDRNPWEERTLQHVPAQHQSVRGPPPPPVKVSNVFQSGAMPSSTHQKPAAASKVMPAAAPSEEAKSSDDKAGAEYDPLGVGLG